MDGGRKFGLTVKGKQKSWLTSVQANSFRILTTYISLIIWVAQQRYQLLQVSRHPFLRGFRKVKNLISEWLEIFSKKYARGCLFRTYK